MFIYPIHWKFTFLHNNFATENQSGLKILTQINPPEKYTLRLDSLILPSIYFSSHQTFHFNCYYFSLFTQVSSFKWRPRYICTQTKFTGSLESSDRFCHLKIGSSWLAALHLISLMHSFRFCLVIAEKSQNLKDFLCQKFAQILTKYLNGVLA